jgi:adenosine/AMP kinase
VSDAGRSLGRRPFSEETKVKLLHVVPLEKPEPVNVIVGQAHFVKTVEDLYEAMVGASAQLRFRIAFCESSGPRLVRRVGNDDERVKLATRHALAIGAGHCFVVLLREGYPVNVLNAVKQVPEVCRVCSARPRIRSKSSSRRPTAAEGSSAWSTGSRRWGVETDADARDRHELLRRIGYKL